MTAESFDIGQPPPSDNHRVVAIVAEGIECNGASFVVPGSQAIEGAQGLRGTVLHNPDGSDPVVGIIDLGPTDDPVSTEYSLTNHHSP